MGTIEFFSDLKAPVIAIDGFAVTGKGTVRARVARNLSFHQLDSGVLYRVVAWEYNNRLSDDLRTAVEIIQDLSLRVEGEKVFIREVDRTKEIRSTEAGRLASVIAAWPEVRRALMGFQLSMRKDPGLVADGRDMGVIFDTPFRFFLKADPHERARRSVEQLERLGQSADFATVLAEIQRRDVADETRAIAPLKPHPMAREIDTTSKNPDDVVDEILGCYSRGSVE